LNFSEDQHCFLPTPLANSPASIIISFHTNRHWVFENSGGLFYDPAKRNHTDPDKTMFSIRDLAKRVLGQIDKALEFFGGSPIVHHADNGTAILQVSHPEPRPEGKTPGSTGPLLMIEDRTTRSPFFDATIGPAVPGCDTVKSGLGDRDREFSH